MRIVFFVFFLFSTAWCQIIIIHSGKLIDGEQPVGQDVAAGSVIFKLDQGTMAMETTT